MPEHGPFPLAMFANPVGFSIVKLGKATGAGHGQEIIPGVAEAVGRIVGTAA